MPSAEELKAKGNAHFVNKEYKEAIKAYTDAIELDSSNAVLYSNRSAAHLGIGNTNAALKDAEDSLAVEESYTKGFLRKSKALYALGRPAHAEQALKDGLEKFPADPILTQGLKEFYKEEDGDQSKLRGYLPGSPAQNMRDFQSAEGMKMGSPQMFFSLPNDAMRAAWRRGWSDKAREKDAQFEEILKLVLEKGWCRVDALDIAGYTALSHAAGHHPQIELAKILIEHGADPSSKNRMGATPLFTAIMSQELEAIKLLLDAGSDPKAVDYEGASIEQIASATSPKIVAMLHEAANLNQENRNIAPGGNCNNPSCGKAGAMKRGVESMIPTSAVAEMISRAWGIKDGGTMTAEELESRSIDISKSRAKAAKDENMVVKVQVPVTLLPGQRNEMLLYNKSRSFSAHCDGGVGAGRELAALIKAKGIQGAKGYFLGYVEKEGELTLIVDKMLPAQPW
ncbi:hypothetical protein Ndes2526A_g08722 [Nannochloris sp. 'desiccata']